MPVSREEVDAWFAANPNAKPDEIAAAVKGIGGLDANAGLSDILAGRLNVSSGEVQNYYNNFTAPTGALAQANTTTTGATGASPLSLGLATNNANEPSPLNSAAVTSPTSVAATEVAKPLPGADKYNIVKGNTDVGVTPVYDYFTEGSGDSQTQNSRIIGYTDQNGKPVDPSLVRTDVDLDGTVNYLAPLGIGLGATSYIDKATGKEVNARDYRIATNQASDVDKLTAQILGQGISGKWQGEGFGSAEANAEDMARILLTAGITDINDFGKFPKYDEAGNKIAEVYGNKKTGEIIDIDYVQADTAKNIWSGTYAGNDSTSYGVQFDAAGNPIFYTQPGESSSDWGKVAPILTVLSFIPGVAPFAMAANAVGNLANGNVLGAVLSGLGAYGEFLNADIAMLQAADASGDIINASQLLDLQNTAANIKLGTTAIGGATALERGDIAGLINAGMSGATQLGVTLPSGVTTGVQVGNVLSSLGSGNPAGALNALGDLVGSPDIKTGAAALALVQAISSDNPDLNAIANAAKNLSSAVSRSTSTDGGITNRVVDDVVPQGSAGSNAYIAAINAGATEEEALAAANAVTGETAATVGATDGNGVVVNKIPDSVNNSVITKPVDDGEGNLAGAQADATARNTVTIGNAEANDLTEAAALAKVRDPSASSFTFGGKTYTMSASNDQVRSIAIQNDIASAPTFNEALNIARDQLGTDKTFTWKGKEYSTATPTQKPDSSITTSSGAGAGRGSYLGYNSAEDAASKANLTVPKTNELLGYINDNQGGGYDALGNPIGGQAIGASPDLSTTSGKIANGVSNAMNTFFGVVANAPVDAVRAGGNLMSNAGGIVDLVAGKSTDVGNKLRDLAGKVDTFSDSITDPKIKTQQQAIGSAIDKADGLINKTAALATSAYENPLGAASWVFTEAFEEVPGVGLALKAGSKLGTYGIAIASDMMESGGSAYNDTYKAGIKQGMSEEDARVAARNSSIAAMAVTGVTQGVVEGKLLTKAIGKDAAGEFTEGALQSGATQLALGQDLSVDKMLTQGVIEAGVGKGANSTAAGITATNIGSDTASTTGAATGAGTSGAATAVGTTPAGDLGGTQAAVTVQNAQQAMADLGLNVSDDVAVSLATNIQNATSNSAVNSDVKSGIENGEDASAVVSSAVASSVEAGANVDSSVASSVSSAIAAGADVNTAVAAAVDAATKAGNKVTVTSDADTTTITNATTNTTTTVDNNTGVATTVNADTNVKTTVNANTNTTTTVDANTNTNTTINANTNTQTTVVTNTSTNTQTTVSVNTETGEVIDKKETDIKDGGDTEIVETPIVPGDGSSVTKTAPITPKTPTKATPAAKLGAAGAGAAFAGGAMGLPSTFDINGESLRSWETQGRIDPLARVKEAQAELERDIMMNQIDPRLMQVMQQRMDPNQQANQLEQDTGALAKILRGESPDASNPAASNEGRYYSYGAEDSIDDILGGKAANYKEGGFVEPLKASGGMVLPLLAKSGGALGHYNGREDFKDGKHVAGEGDGQSDDIPAWLADGEFVFPADVVSALGNGSTKAGTDKLYEMMHGIRDRARSKGPKDLPPPALKSALDYLKSSKRSSK